MNPDRLLTGEGPVNPGFLFLYPSDLNEKVKNIRSKALDE